MAVTIEHEYKGNKITQFTENDFVAFSMNADGDIESKNCSTLEDAQKWLDKQIA